jgi:asparagine synthase (glutamine-hydrolysing)
MSTYLPGDLLVKADRMTMAHSLEGRSPFLDHELFEWAARLPEKMKVRGLKGKYLLRKAFADYLPESVQHRGKQGFGIPIGAWLRGDLSGWAQDVIYSSQNPLNDWFDRRVIETLFKEHLSGQVDHGKRLWALVVLGNWANQKL